MVPRRTIVINEGVTNARITIFTQNAVFFFQMKPDTYYQTPFEMQGFLERSVGFRFSLKLYNPRTN